MCGISNIPVSILLAILCVHCALVLGLAATVGKMTASGWSVPSLEVCSVVFVGSTEFTSVECVHFLPVES